MTTRVVIRGVRIKQWIGQKGIEKLIQHAFPGTRFWVRCGGRERYQIWWAGNPAYEDMRALADDIEAARSATSALTIECCYEKNDPPRPARP